MQRKQNPSGALVLDRSDEAFHYGNAPVLADGAVSRRADAFPLNPPPERFAVEDAISIADEVPGRGVGRTDCSAQERADGTAVWLLGENAHVDDPAREMVDNDSDPPTKRPALWQGERQPRCPQPRAMGTVVRSTCHTWLGSFAVTRRPVRMAGCCEQGCGGSLRIRPTVVAPR